jgi:hypothetical protein
MAGRRHGRRRTAYRVDRATQIFGLVLVVRGLQREGLSALPWIAAGVAAFIAGRVGYHAFVRGRRSRFRDANRATWRAAVLADGGPPGWGVWPIWTALLLGQFVRCRIALDPDGMHLRPGPVSRWLGVKALTIPWNEVKRMTVEPIWFGMPKGRLSVITNEEITVHLRSPEPLALLMLEATDFLGRAGTLRRDYGAAGDD